MDLSTRLIAENIEASKFLAELVFSDKSNDDVSEHQL